NASFVRVAFQIKERRNLCAWLYVSRTRAQRRRCEGSKNAAMVCIEHYDGVVIRRAVISRVDPCDLDSVALTAGVTGLEIGLEHGANRRVPCRGEIGDGLDRCRPEVCRVQTEAFLKRRRRCAKRHSVCNCPLFSPLHNWTRVQPWDSNVETITAWPGRR